MGLTHLLAAGPIRNALLLRGFAAWWVVRIFAAWGGAGAYGNPAVSLTVVGLAATMVLLDARRRNEDLFLGNLGVASSAVLTLSAVPAVFAETLLFVALVAAPLGGSVP